MIDEYYIAAKDLLTFKNYLAVNATDFPLSELKLTRIENEWIDLNADDKID
jgi:hypothetical protein